MSLTDITPTTPRDPFAYGALLPETLTTRNSRYDIRTHAVRTDRPDVVTVTCVVGTFAGESWVVPTAAVHVTREGFHVLGEVGLHTTRIETVNGHPVSTWGR